MPPLRWKSTAQVLWHKGPNPILRVTSTEITQVDIAKVSNTGAFEVYQTTFQSEAPITSSPNQKWLSGGPKIRNPFQRVGDLNPSRKCDDAATALEQRPPVP
jgi:hypothetical protein